MEKAEKMARQCVSFRGSSSQGGIQHLPPQQGQQWQPQESQQQQQQQQQPQGHLEESLTGTFERDVVRTRIDFDEIMEVTEKMEEMEKLVGKTGPKRLERLRQNMKGSSPSGVKAAVASLRETLDHIAALVSFFDSAILVTKAGAFHHRNERLLPSRGYGEEVARFVGEAQQLIGTTDVITSMGKQTFDPFPPRAHS